MDKNTRLTNISNRFEMIKKNPNLGEREKTRQYVDLMNELEHDFGSFILYPTENELKREDVVLYREISDSRTF